MENTVFVALLNEGKPYVRVNISAHLVNHDQRALLSDIVTFVAHAIGESNVEAIGQ